MLARVRPVGAAALGDEVPVIRGEEARAAGSERLVDLLGHLPCEQRGREHNWGLGNTDVYVWAQCNAWTDAPSGTWFEGATGRLTAAALSVRNLGPGI